MDDDEFRRITAEFQQRVLELLTSGINEAFDRALAGLPRDAVPSEMRRRRPAAEQQRKPKMRRRMEPIIQAVEAPEPQPPAAPVEPDGPKPPRSPRAKGASRSEVDRLVEQGLARRLADDSPTTAPPQ